ncbi:MAG TPA: alpha/beta hydrolase [Ktedonobacteraceae bacterium]|nr:alpha/beta hydrolase [Ktedonobacteraceae bacterium]
MGDSAFSPEVIPLWPDGAPGTEDWSQQESEMILPLFNRPQIVRNVTQPTLTAYLPAPDVANGTAVIVCPGGGHHFLSIESEGLGVARWLNERGVAAFVLKYRIIPTAERNEDFIAQMQIFAQSDKPMRTHNPIAVADGLQAIRIVRSRASEWGIDAERIGIVGFSAGGAVALGAATQYDVQSRPNFAAPIYAALWQELVVPADAPPLFLLVANDDPLIRDGSIPIYSAWKSAGISVELHIYAKGGHGFGMNKQGLPTDHWIERLSEWLQSLGFPA